MSNERRKSGEGLAGYVRERPAVEALQGMRQEAAGGFEMTLQADFHFAFGAQARGIHDRGADLLGCGVFSSARLLRAAARVRGISGNRFPAGAARDIAPPLPGSSMPLRDARIGVMAEHALVMNHASGALVIGSCRNPGSSPNSRPFPSTSQEATAGACRAAVRCR